MNLVLIGFMGVGKSAVGRILADRLGMSFLDTDALIEQKEGRKIAAIFAQEGEPYFRRLETDVILGLQGKDNLVLSTGGGVVLKEENVSPLKAIGTILLLSAEPEVIFERIRMNADRPLLQVDDPKEEIAKLLEGRKPYYNRAADYTFNTTKNSPAEIAEEIIQWLKLR